MRIHPTTNYPYPVLSPFTTDYEQNIFDLEITSVQEVPDLGEATTEGKIILDSPVLAGLIAKGQAVSGLTVTCRDTYFDLWQPYMPGAFTLSLREGKIRGKVYIQALIVAQCDLLLPMDGVNDWPVTEALPVQAGHPLAISKEYSFDAGFEKLEATESIFSLSEDSSVEAGLYLIDLAGEKIDIRMSPALASKIHQIRANSQARDLLLSALYVPVLMEALESLEGSMEADDEERRWARVLRAKCDARGIRLREHGNSLAEYAQRILDVPLPKMVSALEV